MNKTGIIYGCTGQIGSYLGEYLLEKGYKVIGVARRTSFNNRGRLTNCLRNESFTLVEGDVTDPFSLVRGLNNIVIDRDMEYEIYNLSAQSHVHTSFFQPQATANITGIGHLNLLEALLGFHNLKFKIKLYFMNSSEIFGSQRNSLDYQDLGTPMIPNSPYAAAKLYAYHMNRIYRESYGMFNTAGIIFNSESPRRGEEFVTRKITKWFADFMINGFTFKKKLQLGNIFACRDWTHAKDTVRAIHLINTNHEAKDYIVATGETHTIHDFLNECYEQAKSIMGKSCLYKLEDLFEVNKDFFRPNEVKYLRGDFSKINKDLGWKPQIDFPSLVYDMLKSDFLSLLKNID